MGLVSRPTQTTTCVPLGVSALRTRFHVGQSRIRKADLSTGSGKEGHVPSVPFLALSPPGTIELLTGAVR